MLGPRVTGVSKTFCDSVNKTLGENAEKVLQAYDITSDLSDDEGLYTILKFSTDISFFAPAIALAKGLAWKSIRLSLQRTESMGRSLERRGWSRFRCGLPVSELQ